MALKSPIPSLDELADACLAQLVENPDQLAEFMVQSGLSPDVLRTALGRTDFKHGLVDYIVSNEPLLLAVAAQAKWKPETVMMAWQKLRAAEL